MNLTDNLKLLGDYVDHGDEAAFRELVERYIDLVYSTALRRVGDDADLAQDVTQTVFVDLARKARSLRNVEMFGGWLHRHTGFVASNALRKERRRQIREQQAVQMNALNQPPDAVWKQLAPVLDETIEFLEPQDRQAILLRFFERQDFRIIGAMLGISDDAAQKRVSRALDKLRDLLAKKGVTLSVLLLGTMMAGKVVRAAPPGLAAKVAGLAFSGASSAGMMVTLAKFANSVAFKIAVGVVLAGVALKFLLPSHSARSREMARQGEAGPSLVKTDRASTPELNSPTPVAAPGSTPTVGPANSTNGNLSLTILADDSGQRVPDVELDYWTWVRGNVNHHKPLHATRAGICEVPVPEGTTELILVSQIDGFADTRLQWHPDRGEKIPAQFKLRLTRATQIGGYVEDPDGKPVAGAQVGFNNQVDPALDAQIETDDFGWPFWITATTDEQGHWQINRIGKAAVRSLYGSASHPDFVQSPMLWVGHDTGAESELLAGKRLFSLGRAVTVRGIVQDESGQPVPHAKILVGHAGESGRREMTNQSDGTFSVNGCKPGKNVITADAEGYAATTLPVDLAADSTPFRLVLHAGHILKLRVVDSSGNAVPKANVWLNTFESMNAATSAPPVQVDFDRKTDANGRLEWDSAPDEELSFDVGANGYIRGSGINFRPDGNEHVITLQPALTISGTVTDAATGQPIPRFRLVTGWPEWNPKDNSTNAQWSSIERFWLNFEGGKFRYTYEEPALGGTTNIEFMFKFEAEGYAPFVSRVVQASERDVRLDVALTPASGTVVTILLPDGGPAADAQVGLAAKGARLSLIPGGFSTETQSGNLAYTDEKGQFELSADPAITRVIAATPQGYGEAAPSELAGSPSIRLQPWGKLEGTLVSAGQPAADRLLFFGLAQNHSDVVDCNFMAFQTKTDAQGRFAFAQVPPGNHELILLVPGKDDTGGTYWMHQPLQEVAIRPGQTTTVSVGDGNQAGR